MNWKVHLTYGGKVLTGERKLTRDGFEMVGFWLIGVKDEINYSFEAPVFIPWSSVLFVEEVA
jgi:hypothetical protein